MADIKHSIVISAPQEQIRPLVASAAGLAKWWAADTTQTPDGAVELGFFNKSTVYRLRSESQSDHEVRWLCETGDEWNGTRIEFELLENGETTTLRFKHKGWSSETDYFTLCNTTWGTLMYRLKAAAEGRSPLPLFSERGLND